MGARHVVKRVSALADRLAPPPAGVTVLLYHRVGGGSDSAVDLDPELFDRQLAHLVSRHEVISLDAAADLLRPPREDWDPPTARGDDVDAGTTGRSPVVVTFDDGTRDFVDVALPVLARHRVPATVYVATRFVDEQVPFPWGAPPTTWEALREAAASGLVTVGSHTHDHRLLDRLHPDATRDELDRSIDLLARHLGDVPSHFAYPKGRPGSTAAEITVRRRFRTASLAGSGVNRIGRTDLHRLRRTPVQRGDGFDGFVLKAAGGHRLEGVVRSAVDRVRYRGAQR